MIRTRKLKLIQKASRFLLVFAVISGWIFSGFPQMYFEYKNTITPEGTAAALFDFPPQTRTAEAAAANIRQEINIIDVIVSAAGDDSAIVQLDTNAYSGATYIFETIAKVDSGTLTVALERVGTATQDATIPVTATTYTRQRASFTPPAAAQTEYNINLANGTAPLVKAARIIITQSADPIAATETQIEIGNAETGKTNTATAALTNPKYWLYDSSLWDGTISFSAEVTYRDYQVASSTTWDTAGTFTGGYVESLGVSYITAEAWGGGAGGGCAGASGGGGGGGGGYARSTTTPTGVGTAHDLVVGAAGAADTAGGGGNSTYDSTIVVGDGGNGTASGNAGTGGTTNTGDFTAAGASGGASDGTPDTGGGGGGAGGPGGAGNTGQAGQAAAGGAGGNANGGTGTEGNAGNGACSSPSDGTGAGDGKVGSSAVTGGGGGGGSDSTCAWGGVGGAPGGGGGGGDNNTCTANSAVGARGQIRIQETHGMVGIALEQDTDGAFGSWVNIAQIVTDGTATSSPDRVRVSFAPTNGRHYRLVASTTDSTASYDIYNAKIVVTQTANPTKLEAQYLLLNTADSGSVGLQAYQTLYDANDWTGATVAFKVSHDATNASDSSKLVDITAEPDTDLTNGSVTGANQQIGASAITDLVDDTQIDVNVTNTTGVVTAARMLAQVTLGAANSPPTVDSVTLDRTTITLNENTFVWASSTILVTDTNGCSEITTVEASLVFASTTQDQGAFLCGAAGANYSYDANLCYLPTSCVATTTGNQCAADNDVEYDCGFQIWYPARPTDNSAPGADLQAAQWFVVGSTTDNIAASVSATNTTQTVEVGTLNALTVTGTIAYPETAPGSNTVTNQTATVTNTGNTASDTEVSGTWMCTDYPTCATPGERIDDDQQKFDISDVAYASLANTMSSTTPATIETVLATTSATTTTVTADTFWGISIPNGRPTGSYTGANTFGAVAD